MIEDTLEAIEPEELEEQANVNFQRLPFKSYPLYLGRS